MSVLASNRRKLMNYVIVESYMAGISLLGTEVKSLRLGKGVLDGSYIAVKDGELWLRKASIPAYQEKNISKSYDPQRDRKILLKKVEINKIIEKLNTKGYTLIPEMIRANQSSHKVEIKIVLTKHAKKQDKREAIKKKDTKRQLEREIKGKIGF